MERLTVDDLLEIAAGVLAEVVVRDTGLLASAAARPWVTVFGEDAYPDLHTKAAALLHSLARNHPLVDGNKRLAWSSMKILLILNGIELTYEIDDAEAMVVGVASGALDVPDVVGWIASHLVT